jgi:tetratricopeptide (TPR) repeat protein
MADDRGFNFSIPLPTGPLVELSFADMEKRFLARLEDEAAEPEPALWELVRFYSLAGRLDTAETYVRRLMERTGDPEARGAHLLALGQLMEKREDFVAAARFYRQGLGCEPADPRTSYFLRNNLGYSLNVLGDHVEAEDLCRAAIRIEPVRSNAHKNLGIALAGQERFEDAARAYVAAVRANAADPRALRHLEQLLEAHPDLEVRVPEIKEELGLCRGAVAAVEKIQKHNAPRVHRGFAGRSLLFAGDVRRWFARRWLVQKLGRWFA